MRAVDIIAKKRDGYPLSAKEIDFFVQGFTRGQIPDYQASSLLMAIYIKGMSEQETVDLTMSMARSGKRVTIAFTLGFTRSICARCASMTSTHETSFVRIRRTSSVASIKHSSLLDIFFSYRFCSGL